MSFHSDWGSIRRIEYERIPPEALSVFENPRTRDVAYRAYIDSMWVPRAQSQFPGVIVLQAELIGQGAERAYFAVVRVPEVSQSVDLRTQKRLDSVAQLLVFAHGAYLYVVEVGEPKGASEEESDEYTPDGVLAFKKEIEFR